MQQFSKSLYDLSRLDLFKNIYENANWYDHEEEILGLA